jgi:four helix bundle protein
MKGYHRHSRDELIRASQSIPRNIAEGNGKRSFADRSRFFEISRGSALECASVLDQLHLTKVLENDETRDGKKMLQRIVKMLTKMTEPKKQKERIGEERKRCRKEGKIIPLIRERLRAPLR